MTDTTTLTDDEIDQLEADKAERADEIATAVAEGIENAKADMKADFDKQLADAITSLKASIPAGANAVVDKRPKTGIHDPNPMKAKLAREKSKTKKVIVTSRGYYGVTLYEEGQVFDVPLDETADWFEDYKGAKGGSSAEELV